MLGPMEIALLLGVAVLAAAGLTFWLIRRGGSSNREIAYSHFRCPGCRRRLRYQSRQVGHKGECSNCGREITFPPVSQSVD